MFDRSRLEDERNDDGKDDDEGARTGGEGMGAVGGINTSCTFLPKPRPFKLRLRLRQSLRVHFFPTHRPDDVTRLNAYCRHGVGFGLGHSIQVEPCKV